VCSSDLAMPRNRSTISGQSLASGARKWACALRDAARRNAPKGNHQGRISRKASSSRSDWYEPTILLRNASPWGIPDMLIGVGILIYAGVQMDVPPGMYVLGLIPIALAVMVLYSLWFIFASFSIWYVKIWNATEVLRGLLEAGRYPRAAFPGFVQIFFTFIVPVAFMTTVPAEVLMGKATATWMIAEAAIAIGLFIFSRIFWRFALRYYTSASS